jgi:hypothetical protein
MLRTVLIIALIVALAFLGALQVPRFGGTTCCGIRTTPTS